VVVAQVARLEQVPAAERLDPERLMQDIKDSGKVGAYLPDVDSIVEHVRKQAGGGDVVCVFSNGGFGGIHSNCSTVLGGPKPSILRRSFLVGRPLPFGRIIIGWKFAKRGFSYSEAGVRSS